MIRFGESSAGATRSQRPAPSTLAPPDDGPGAQALRHGHAEARTVKPGESMYLVWHRVGQDEKIDSYTRQILVRTFLDEKRRGFFRRERPISDVGDRPLPEPDDHVENRMVLAHALAAVAPRQRAVLVLRIWEDLSVEDTAKVLGCTTGTVKSQLARGLATMRSLVPANSA